MRASRCFGFVLISSLTVVLGSGACARQGEGERCDVLSESEDCDSQLVCTPGDQLAGSNVDRCCPPPDQQPTDPRCLPGSGAAGTGGGADASPEAAGTGGAGGGGTGGADAAEGSSGCSYNSDCEDGLVCGPLGRCQPECNVDRDCRPTETCVSGKCTAPVDASVE